MIFYYYCSIRVPPCLLGQWLERRRFWALPKCIVKNHSKYKKIMTLMSPGTPKAQHGTFPCFAMTTPFTLRWYPIAMGNHPNQVDSSWAEYQWKNAFWWPWCCGAEWPPGDAMLPISKWLKQCEAFCVRQWKQQQIELDLQRREVQHCVRQH